MNTMRNAIVENRYMAKVQLTADDMGGVGCDNWNQYRQLCDNLAKAAWNHTVGKDVDRNVLGICVSALFNFFGIEVTDSSAYHARILSSCIVRKVQKSDTYKDASKARTAAKTAWEDAVAENKPEEELAELKAKYDECVEYLNELQHTPMHYWKDPAPMLTKDKRHATAECRKALEDACADIANEREFMTAEELQAEAQRLADERKGRKMRKKAEEKAQANA